MDFIHIYVRCIYDIGFLQSLTQLGIFDRVDISSVVAVYLLLAQLGGSDSLTRRHVHECLWSCHPAIVGIEVGDKLGLHYIDDVAILVLCYVSCGLEQWYAWVVHLLHWSHLLVKTREAQARLGCVRGLLWIGVEVKAKGSSGRIRLSRWCELILWSQWCRHSSRCWLYPSHVGLKGFEVGKLVPSIRCYCIIYCAQVLLLAHILCELVDVGYFVSHGLQRVVEAR